ncbi:unnamed protein product [Amoebophrya sp. A120]|nr:unnamed protein product [Amoebophrya sp. A120]|eukprot:GSA120T00020799001.1
MKGSCKRTCFFSALEFIISRSLARRSSSPDQQYQIFFSTSLIKLVSENQCAADLQNSCFCTAVLEQVESRACSYSFFNKKFLCCLAWRKTEIIAQSWAPLLMLASSTQ